MMYESVSASYLHVLASMTKGFDVGRPPGVNVCAGVAAELAARPPQEGSRWRFR